MAQPIEVSVVIAADIETVWADLARIETHPEWMRDAESIEFLTDQQRGAGTRIRVPTRVGPLTTTDEMTFTAWEPPHRMAITHEGAFTGSGELVLEPAPAGTRLTWREEIKFPLTFGGPIGARVAAPILTRIWRGNLQRFAERFS